MSTFDERMNREIAAKKRADQRREVANVERAKRYVEMCDGDLGLALLAMLGGIEHGFRDGCEGIARNMP